MRKIMTFTAASLLLMGAAATAADLPSRTMEPVPPPMVDYGFTWGGFYFGSSLGMTKGKASWYDLSGYNGFDHAFNYKPRGFASDIHAGYNVQAGMMVFGVEGEVGVLNLKKSLQYPPFIGVRGPLESVARTGNGVYGALSGRVGIAIDSLMIYGKAGVVTSDIRQKFTDDDPAGAVLVSGTATKAPRNGYLLGAGAALALNDSLSLRADYEYFNFGKQNHTAISNFNVPVSFRHGLAASVFKVGLDYHFGSAGPVAAPIIAKN